MQGLVMLRRAMDTKNPAWGIARRVLWVGGRNFEGKRQSGAYHGTSVKQCLNLTLQCPRHVVVRCDPKASDDGGRIRVVLRVSGQWHARKQKIGHAHVQQSALP